jgi:hypothetical protein
MYFDNNQSEEDKALRYKAHIDPYNQELEPRKAADQIQQACPGFISFSPKHRG